MAEAVVYFAVERVGDLLVSEAENLSEVYDQIYEIQHELKRIQCFLKEADKKQYRDKRVRRWVTEIRRLAFRVEDVIETFALEVATEPAGFNGDGAKICCSVERIEDYGGMEKGCEENGLGFEAERQGL
ncbi:hypothetical protein POM88_033079 [Heracleum sosnowskyi]|uniref:Disease resistance N-terminal domain-containing protein n=1 Tax=Heracleum sosnowskyi TaxID=360622 RepID=A0AAD8I1P6_9APIA|nr:hypothetical protein POM88_033079 [Heracleum sosnowskyi]